ncbi:MAG: hypothetical protein AAGF20_06205 [Pseudomonadota bacterium]
MSSPDQYSMAFLLPPLSFGDMAITDANRDVIEQIRTVDRWAAPVFCLTGPPKSGLTTLAKAWAYEQTGSYITSADFDAVAADQMSSLSGRPLAIDRADLITEQSALLGIINGALQTQAPLLLTARHPPSHWDTPQRDLSSRLRLAVLAGLGHADDALMAARLRRAFELLCVNPPDRVIDYLVTRGSLDYCASERFVQRLVGAMGDGQDLTVALVRGLLDEPDDAHQAGAGGEYG